MITKNSTPRLRQSNLVVQLTVDEAHIDCLEWANGNDQMLDDVALDLDWKSL